MLLAISHCCKRATPWDQYYNYATVSKLGNKTAQVINTSSEDIATNMLFFFVEVLVMCNYQPMTSVCYYFYHVDLFIQTAIQ